MTLSPSELYDVMELEGCINATLGPSAPLEPLTHIAWFKKMGRHAGDRRLMGIATQTVGAHISFVAKRLRVAVRAWQSSASGDVV